LNQDRINSNNVTNVVSDSADRIATVCHGIKVYATHASVAPGEF
jgi:hypothetical protein